MQHFVFFRQSMPGRKLTWCCHFTAERFHLVAAWTVVGAYPVVWAQSKCSVRQAGNNNNSVLGRTDGE